MEKALLSLRAFAARAIASRAPAPTAALAAPAPASAAVAPLALEPPPSRAAKVKPGRVVGCDIDRVLAAVRLIHETMPLDTWEQRARDLLGRDLPPNAAADNRINGLLAGIRQRLLTVDPAEHWLVEDRWLRAVQEERGRPEGRALVAVRWYAEQTPVVRAAERVRALRLGHSDGWWSPGKGPVLRLAELDGCFQPPLPAREIPAQRRALAHALHDLGLVDTPKPTDDVLRVTASGSPPVAAFGWLLRYDLRRHRRMEAPVRWVAWESLAGRLLALSPTVIADRLVYQIESWVGALSYLAGEPRVVIASHRDDDGGPEPSSSAMATRILAEADRAERQRFDPKEVEGIVASFRKHLGPYFASYHDPS
jgi:hypothetical protein